MRHIKLGAAALTLAALALRVAATPATAAGAPDTCVTGYVWREARPSDHVCVTPAVREQTRRDNRVKASRWVPGPSGPHTCVQGYVWREAFPGDHVCVTPAVRAQARADNAAAASRRASGAIRSPITINRDVRFGGGIPVGGRTSLTLHADGTYTWSGHLRDSGAPSYNISSVCVVRFSSGTAYAFKSSGRLHGTFEPGSRNHDWNKSGRIATLPAAWRASQSHRWSCKNSVSLSLSGLVDSALQVVGAAAKVVSIVA
ncbi:hypothetical protein ETD86_18655 [Nonomuraea turkmeniaca]|uniref:Uncharacterized protein n=1 Tax=Nonomuraea turkmeniaca TaxID=103838 RepID=A0A5S4FJ93_9ACTN|nr:hypothetical protein [Nonomuraea turkmeniaca]TMR20564.1 hypothetical protein ETD86_18655 [Nonomuraea turkmeniaca]